MTLMFNALVLLFDLLFTPFVVGALAAALAWRITRKPRLQRVALLAGASCALVHAIGVFSLLWRDGDWIGYFVMAFTAAAVAVLVRT